MSKYGVDQAASAFRQQNASVKCQCRLTRKYHHTASNRRVRQLGWQARVPAISAQQAKTILYTTHHTIPHQLIHQRVDAVLEAMIPSTRRMGAYGNGSLASGPSMEHQTALLVISPTDLTRGYSRDDLQPTRPINEATSHRYLSSSASFNKPTANS